MGLAVKDLDGKVALLRTVAGVEAVSRNFVTTEGFVTPNDSFRCGEGKLSAHGADFGEGHDSFRRMEVRNNPFLIGTDRLAG